MKKLVIVLILGIVVLSTSSCQKENDSEPAATAAGNLLTKVATVGSTNTETTLIEIAYDGNNKFSSATTPGGATKPEYDASGKLMKLLSTAQFYPVYSRTVEFTYTGSNVTEAKTTSYTQSGTVGEIYTDNFEYNASNQLTKVTFIMPKFTRVESFTWTSDNISKIVAADVNGVTSSTEEYTYDDKVNPLKAGGIFLYYYYNRLKFATVLSKGNIVKRSYVFSNGNGGSSTNAYTYNTANYPLTQRDTGGSAAEGGIKYYYK